MNNTIKISMTVIMLGSVMVRSSNSENISFILDNKDDNPNDYDRKYKGTTRHGEIKHYSKTPKNCSQHLSISQDAYDSMTSQEVPYWSNKHTWGRMSKKQRLEAHLQRISEDLNGLRYTYEVLDN